jgi:hypothetical protein
VSTRLIRLIDRTRTVTDWKCPRARYWGYEYLGKGLAKQGTNLDLFIGIITHDAMAAVATFTARGEAVPIDQIAEAAFTQIYENILAATTDTGREAAEEFAREQGTLTQGMILGFYKHVWPRLMAQYPKIVAIEQEMEYTLGEDKTSIGHNHDVTRQFIFMAKPDLIVEDQNGELVYLEYKTTSSKKDKWIKSWDTAVQLHSSILATEQTLGKRPAYVQIVGLYKGYESYGKQSSPFCYAYKKSGNPPFTQDQVQYEFKAGFKRVPTWEMAGGVKAWVEGMPDTVLADQYPMTPQIMVDEQLVNDFFKQRLIREKEISTSVWEGEYDSPVTGIDSVFPQRFDQCEPSFGYSCPFKKLCFGHVTDPLTEGYELRTPHHARELEQHAAN